MSSRQQSSLSPHRRGSRSPGFFFARPAADLELWREFDLMPPQQIVLGLLDEPRPMGELAPQMHCDSSNMTGIVDRLEERGLVERGAAEWRPPGEAGRADRRRPGDPRRAHPPPLRSRRTRSRPSPTPTCASCARSSPKRSPGSLRSVEDLGNPSSYLTCAEGPRSTPATARSWARSSTCSPTRRPTSSTAW